MKTIGTDGRTYILNPSKSTHDVDDTNRSKLHLKAREVIKGCFPYSYVYEEVTLTGCRGNGGYTLIADFYLPDVNIIIEVHGEQHYKINSYFFKSESKFKKAISNDEIKKSWAEDNEITFIVLPYNEVENWKKILESA